MNSIAEKDWKLLRAMKEEKLNQVCGEILQKVSQEMEFEENEEYKAYLKLWKVLNREDKKVSDLFDDLKRSNAIFKLLSWRQNGLITEQEFNRFSEETRSIIMGIESL